MYLPLLAAATGALRELRLIPTRIRNFRLCRAADEEARWLSTVLNRDGRVLGTAVEDGDDGSLRLTWGSVGK